MISAAVNSLDSSMLRLFAFIWISETRIMLLIELLVKLMIFRCVCVCFPGLDLVCALKWIIDWVSQYYWSQHRKRSSGFWGHFLPQACRGTSVGSWMRLVSCMEDDCNIRVCSVLCRAAEFSCKLNKAAAHDSFISHSRSPAEGFWWFLTGLWVIQSVTDSECGRETLWSNTRERVSQSENPSHTLNISHPSLNAPETNFISECAQTHPDSYPSLMLYISCYNITVYT